MGANMKALRVRIKSIDSTLHLTKAMGLVASSKIRRATEQMLRGREYSAAVQNAVRLLTACRECEKSPFMQQRDGGTRLIVIAGDRGLAGGYNANIFRLMREYPDVQVIPIGKRACDRYAPNAETVSSERFSYADARKLAVEQCAAFAAGEYARLGIVCTRFVSVMTQVAQVEWILPLERSETGSTGVIFEPDERTILDAAMPEYVAGRLIAAVRESFASEVAARRTAMDSASDNASTMIDDLMLRYNRARQGAITQEITEIVAGSN